MKKFSKFISVLLSFGLAFCFVACEKTPPTGNNDNGDGVGDGSDDTQVNEQVTRDEWNSAWQTLINANNVTLSLHLVQVEYPETDPYTFDETHTIKIADGKYYEYITGTESGDGESYSFTEEMYAGAVNGRFYEWEYMDDEDYWCFYEIDNLTSFIPLGNLLAYDFSCFIEENGYVNYYSSENYDEDKGAYVITDTQATENITYEIKIVNQKITHVKRVMEDWYNGAVRERNTENYTFTYGSTTIGELPPIGAYCP